MLKYRPRYLFLDGHWNVTTKYANKKTQELCTFAKSMIDGLEINDRIGGSKEVKQLYSNRNYLGLSTYRTYNDREIPAVKPDIPWEHINTVGLSWGRNKQQKEKDYKTGDQLLEIYNKVNSIEGRFLLNLGPNADGTLDEKETSRIYDFANLKSL